MTAGVVRVADTVRRPASEFSAFTADLLELLADKGFTAAPKYLGQDDSGRDILTYVEGWVPSRYQRWSDRQVAAAGALIRAFHDATRDSPLAAGRQVVCHHDPAPTNFVFTDDLPVALIDFDLAEPGDPLEDLGYAAWTWCIASKYGDADRQAAQVGVLADAYGLPATDRTALVDATLERQLRNVQFWTEASIDVADDVRAERIAWSYREHDFTLANRAVFRGGRPS
ncbi:aminoglycoside phosphotransferase family protein [Kribbella speibonae]|uniref:Aminoglycoside phosphotransferase family protein n=2 Tax=Kribbella speibonae TaxID=1572660 RepID=A0A4R0J5E6_9ACTN|nr:aminoglycoside phosphotransferase family protein [Kribbella speibonae]TCC36545.1 aminoglycoside phosphotransferase family protein [Kribbella speibonae]